jgi:S1-C subfamily serine protease
MTNELQQFSDGLAAAVEKAAQSSVTVDSRRRSPATGIVWSADGEILTADHVLAMDFVKRLEKRPGLDHPMEMPPAPAGDEKVNVTLPDGREFAARILGRDPASDLALLKIDAQGLTVPEFVEELKVGHLVLAVGRPDGVQATLGSVVAKGGPVRGRFRSLEAFVQTDVTMYPGFSGGPLVDASGRVAGLNSSALARGASLAIPVSALRAVADALRKDGHVKRGYLGVTTQPVRLAEDMAKKLNHDTGLMLIGAEKDGPAARAGLLQGDVLVKLGDTALTDIEDLQAALGPGTVGKALTAQVVRGGELKDVKVTVGTRE